MSLGLKVIQTARAQRIDALYAMLRPTLTCGGAIPRTRILASLACSPATFKRDLDVLRSMEGVDVVWDRHAGGYRIKAKAREQ